MLEDLLILVPTKGRPELFQRLYASYLEHTAGFSKLIPILDTAELPLYIPDENDKTGGYSFFSVDGFNLVEKLNYGASIALEQGYEYIAFMADDLVVQTPNFDQIIVNEFEANPNINIIHCADLLHNGKIANHWVIRTSVVERVGFFALPVCRHMFIDNFWTKVGRETNTIKYLPNVIWEHRHYMNRKADFDATYKLTNNDTVMKADQAAYEKFINSPKYTQFLEKYINAKV